MEYAQAPTTLPLTAPPPIYQQTQPYYSMPEPPFPPSPHTIDLSPLEFILGLLAVVTIPALIYTFFFAIKCPSLPSSSSSRHRHQGRPSNPNNTATTPALPQDASAAATTDVKFRRDSRVAGDCPVCLSTFCDGEEIKQLGVCKHSFHTICIDMWLSSHSDCPVCRAKVAVKRQNPAPVRSRDTDLQQGLPDAANLV